MISSAEATRPPTAVMIASSERRCAADVLAVARAFSVPRKLAKPARMSASSRAPSCRTISVRLAAGVVVVIWTTGSA